MAFLTKIFSRKELKQSEENQVIAINSEEEEVDFEDVMEEDLAEEGKQKEEEDFTQEEKEYEIVEREILPTKIICPDCGGITLEGLDFCDKCGGEL